MGTTITFETGSITIAITGDQPYMGCTYNKLIDWYGVNGVTMPYAARPYSHGSYGATSSHLDDLRISVEGDYFGADRADALRMREDLAMLYNDGRDVKMTVADDLRTTWRMVKVESVELPWTIHPEFAFTIDVSAADPLRYGEPKVARTELASLVSGMSWPVKFPLAWGERGEEGRLIAYNDGNAATVSRFTVRGGDLPNGFAIVNVATGERITYLGPVARTSTVEIDMGSQSVKINGTGPGAGFLASPQWWEVPPRSSVEVQFLPLGSVVGSPELVAYTPPAYL